MLRVRGLKWAKTPHAPGARPPGQPSVPAAPVLPAAGGSYSDILTMVDQPC
jgi:hypothetical protein